jgi:preprotein translocase SecE subunit
VAEEKKSSVKKPRVRKAPSLREQAEMARTQAEADKNPGKIKKVATKTSGALKKTRITANPVTKLLARVGRGILWILRKLVPKYFVNSWREVRLVAWPARRETWRLVMAVFIFAAIFGAMVAGVDKVLDIIFKKLVLK